jgi:hypothetical protein
VQFALLRGGGRVCWPKIEARRIPKPQPKLPSAQDLQKNEGKTGRLEGSRVVAGLGGRARIGQCSDGASLGQEQAPMRGRRAMRDAATIEGAVYRMRALVVDSSGRERPVKRCLVCELTPMSLAAVAQGCRLSSFWRRSSLLVADQCGQQWNAAASCDGRHSRQCNPCGGSLF